MPKRILPSDRAFDMINITQTRYASIVNAHIHFDTKGMDNVTRAIHLHNLEEFLQKLIDGDPGETMEDLINRLDF